MKLVHNRLSHSDTITTDDNVQLGIIYYGTVPITDDGKNGADVFREWWESNAEMRRIASELAKNVKQLSNEIRAARGEVASEATRGVMGDISREGE